MELQKNFSEQLVTDGIGEEIFALAAKLYPICRSITGDGVRETLREIGTHIDLHVHEVADRYAPSSIGLSRGSGTFATRTSRMSEAKRSSTLPDPTSM